jgi:hypothetical protein
VNHLVVNDLLADSSAKTSDEAARVVTMSSRRTANKTAAERPSSRPCPPNEPRAR